MLSSDNKYIKVLLHCTRRGDTQIFSQRLRAAARRSSCAGRREGKNRGEKVQRNETEKWNERCDGREGKEVDRREAETKEARKARRVRRDVIETQITLRNPPRP